MRWYYERLFHCGTSPGTKDGDLLWTAPFVSQSQHPISSNPKKRKNIIEEEIEIGVWSQFIVLISNIKNHLPNVTIHYRKKNKIKVAPER